jgi:hypothetical protein
MIMRQNRYRSLTGALGVIAICALMIPVPVWTGQVFAAKKPDPVADANERAPGAKITKGEAMQAALRNLPGNVTDVTVERKRGKQVYVIEIVSEKDGSESDVLVDMQSGAVLGIDK